MNELLDKEKLEEGKETTTVTSPVEDAEQAQLNNDPSPTIAEEENAGIAPTSIETESVPTEPVSTEVPAPVTEPENNIPADVASDEAIPESGTTPEAMFTQSQVDEIAGKTRRETREKTLKTMYSRYGVNSEEELDNVFANAQRYDTLQEMYDTDTKSYKEQSAQRDAELGELKEKIALLESGIDKERYDDAKYILKGKGLEISVDTINQELATHPEWKKATAPMTEESHFKKIEKQEPPTQLSVLGNEGGEDKTTPEMSEHDRAMKLFFNK